MPMKTETPREKATPGADASAMDEAAFHSSVDSSESTSASPPGTRDDNPPENPPLQTVEPEGPVLQTASAEDLDQEVDDEGVGEPPEGEQPKQAAPPKEGEEPPKPRGNRKTARQRIAELNTKVHQERQEKEALEARLAALEAQQRAPAPQPAPAAGAEATPATPAPQKSALDQQVEAEIGVYPSEEDARYYDKDGNFLKRQLELDQANWMTQKVLKVQEIQGRQNQARARQVQAVESFKTADQAYAAEHQDYAQTAPLVAKIIFKPDGRVANAELAHEIVEGGGGPKLLHALTLALGEDPDAARNIANLRGVKLGQYVSRWQQKLENSLAQRGQAVRIPEPGARSTAPEPLPHTVTGGSHGSVRKPIQKMTTEEYMEQEGFQ